MIESIVGISSLAFTAISAYSIGRIRGSDGCDGHSWNEGYPVGRFDDRNEKRAKMVDGRVMIQRLHYQTCQNDGCSKSRREWVTHHSVPAFKVEEIAEDEGEDK